MSDNSRVRVSIVGVVIVALFSSLVARLWFLQMGPEQKLRAEAIALSTRVGPDRVAARSRSSTATARCSPATAPRGPSHSIATSTDTTRDRVLGQLVGSCSASTRRSSGERYNSPRQSPLEAGDRGARHPAGKAARDPREPGRLSRCARRAADRARVPGGVKLAIRRSPRRCSATSARSIATS